MPNTEKIACAAIRDKVYPGICCVPVPLRHHDILRIFPSAERVQCEQGFMTSAGRFVTRKEAMKIAKNADQVDPTCREELFTEDLW